MPLRASLRSLPALLFRLLLPLLIVSSSAPASAQPRAASGAAPEPLPARSADPLPPLPAPTPPPSSSPSPSLASPPSSDKAPPSAPTGGKSGANDAPSSAPSDAESGENEASGPHTHDGFYFRAALGASYLSATVTDGATTSGWGPGLELAFGGTPAPGLVVGGGIFGSGAMDPTPYLESAVLSAVGPFIDLYPDPHDGWHLGAMLGLARVVYTSKNSVARASSSVGFSGAFGGGYEFWIHKEWSLGILARLQFASVAVDVAEPNGLNVVTASSTLTVISPSFLMSFTYH